MPALLLLSACVVRVNTETTLTGSPTVTVVEPIDSLRARINRRIAVVPGAEVGLWYKDLATPETLSVAPDVSFHAASTMKLPVMIELFRRSDARTISLSQTLQIENKFASIVDGSPYTLNAGDDSDSLLYKQIGSAVTLRELNQRMITRSSNFATNLLIQQLDAKTITATARALDARNIRVLRGVEDSKAFAQGLNNTTTARDLGVLLLAIENGTAASAASCAAMKDVLLHQEFSTEIPAGLPPGTPVAHKTGWITATLHDAAIVYPLSGRRPYILVVLTRGIPKDTVARALIADISREVYRFALGRSAARPGSTSK